MTGTLFLVGTPIGNLDDLTPRAKETLAGVDLVAAEDTRRTGRLLKTLGVKRPVVSLFEGNELVRNAELLDRLREGANVAVVTDGGMPAISDPGLSRLKSPRWSLANETVTRSDPMEPPWTQEQLNQ